MIQQQMIGSGGKTASASFNDEDIRRIQEEVETLEQLLTAHKQESEQNRAYALQLEQQIAGQREQLQANQHEYQAIISRLEEENSQIKAQIAKGPDDQTISQILLTTQGSIE